MAGSAAGVRGLELHLVDAERPGVLDRGAAPDGGLGTGAELESVLVSLRDGQGHMYVDRLEHLEVVSAQDLPGRDLLAGGLQPERVVEAEVGEVVVEASREPRSRSCWRPRSEGGSRRRRSGSGGDVR
jgi:hypothetical protein